MLYLGFRLWDFSDSGSKVGVLRECRVCTASTRELGKWLESGLSSSRPCWPKCTGAHQFDALLVGSNKYPELAGCYCAQTLKSPKPLNPARHLFLFLPYPYSYSYVYAYSSLLALLLLFSFVLLLCVYLVLYVLLLLVLILLLLLYHFFILLLCLLVLLNTAKSQACFEPVDTASIGPGASGKLLSRVWHRVGFKVLVIIRYNSLVLSTERGNGYMGTTIIIRDYHRDLIPSFPTKNHWV